jgi:hypothetical protein
MSQKIAELEQIILKQNSEINSLKEQIATISSSLQTLQTSLPELIREAIKKTESVSGDEQEIIKKKNPEKLKHLKTKKFIDLFPTSPEEKKFIELFPTSPEHPTLDIFSPSPPKKKDISLNLDSLDIQPIIEVPKQIQQTILKKNEVIEDKKKVIREKNELLVETNAVIKQQREKIKKLEKAQAQKDFIIEEQSQKIKSFTQLMKPH